MSFFAVFASFETFAMIRRDGIATNPLATQIFI